MPKTSLNLLIPKEEESPLLRRLKKILPLLAILSLVIFILLFFISLLYVNSNIFQFNFLKRQIMEKEARISAAKQVEGLYTLTSERVNLINQIALVSKNFSPALGEFATLKVEGVEVTEATLEKQGNLSFSLVASSVEALENFLEQLLLGEEKKLFSQLSASGIVRDRKGNYFLTITAKIDPSLFKK